MRWRSWTRTRVECPNTAGSYPSSSHWRSRTGGASSGFRGGRQDFACGRDPARSSSGSARRGGVSLRGRFLICSGPSRLRYRSAPRGPGPERPADAGGPEQHQRRQKRILFVSAPEVEPMTSRQRPVADAARVAWQKSRLSGPGPRGDPSGARQPFTALKRLDRAPPYCFLTNAARYAGGPFFADYPLPAP
jgi:hypothetical protein